MRSAKRPDDRVPWYPPKMTMGSLSAGELTRVLNAASPADEFRKIHLEHKAGKSVTPC